MTFSRRLRRATPVLALCFGAVLHVGCAASGLSFVQDERLEILRPNDRSEVNLPVTLEWTVKDFEAGPGAGSFGVFVDRPPQPSGKTLSWLFRDDDVCQGTAARLCSTSEFLAQRGVYRTTTTAFTVNQVSRLAGSQAGRKFHEVTVVLLDQWGERVGEGAWSRQFEVRGEEG